MTNQKDKEEVILEYPWGRLNFTSVIAIIIPIVFIMGVANEPSFSSNHIIPGVLALLALHYSLCDFFNKTLIRINQKELRVLNYPIPVLWRARNIHIPLKNIKQVFIEEHTKEISTGRHGIERDFPSDSLIQTSYTLKIKLINNNMKKIPLDLNGYQLTLIQELIEDFIALGKLNER